MRSRRLRSTARTWFWFIAAATLLGGVIALGLSLVAPSGYVARVTILVTPTPKDAGITNGDVQVAQALTPTFAELATTRPVLERVISSTNIEIGVDELAASVTTRVPVATSLLSISVLNQVAADASALANAIGSELRAYATSGTGGPDGALQVELTVVDPATPPAARDGPAVPIRMALGGAIALFLASSIAFLVENVWPRGRETNAAPPMTPPMATPTAPVPDPGRFFADRPRAPIRSDVLEADQSTIGLDPLQSQSAATRARIASRGIVNDLEVEKTRRSD